MLKTTLDVGCDFCDAKLMAAAPIMLETLKATLKQLQTMGELIDDATIQQIITAIGEAQYD